MPERLERLLRYHPGLRVDVKCPTAGGARGAEILDEVRGVFSRLVKFYKKTA